MDKEKKSYKALSKISRSDCHNEDAIPSIAIAILADSIRSGPHEDQSNVVPTVPTCY